MWKIILSYRRTGLTNILMILIIFNYWEREDLAEYSVEAFFLKKDVLA